MAQRRRHGGAFKTQVVVEAIEGHKTVNEIASASELHLFGVLWALARGYVLPAVWRSTAALGMRR